MTEKNRIIIFDTTLRDGEQSAGASMSIEDKVEIATKLNEMKVDIIEAGFPFASKGDFEAVEKVASNSKNSIVCGLARAQRTDIEAARNALKKAKRFRIHTFISTSDLHMKYKLRMNKAERLLKSELARKKRHMKRAIVEKRTQEEYRRLRKLRNHRKKHR